MTTKNTSRTWRDVAAEWIEEPNPDRMALLAQELTNALDEPDSSPSSVVKVQETLKAA